MTQIKRRIALRKPGCLAALLLTLALVTGCAQQEMGSDLAVAKLPKSEVQQMGYLALNDDKPGTKVDVEEYLVPGKYTIVYFFSPYDEQTANLSPQLQQLPEINTSVAVRTVNVNRPEVEGIDWQSPIVQDERLTTLPYVQLYEPSQKLRAHGRPAYTQLMEWLRAVPIQ